MVAPKPKFGPAALWGACSRCNARVLASTLRRERLTGLLVCTKASGRGTTACWDPWPEVLDFQVKPDKSIEPPSEPLPLRYNLDAIWGSGPESGTTKIFANAPAAAPDDATIGKSAAFMGPMARLGDEVFNLTTIVPADWDGTFLPSSSIRTVTPPDEAAELAAVTRTDKDVPADPIWTPPWAQVKQV